MPAPEITTEKPVPGAFTPVSTVPSLDSRRWLAVPQKLNCTVAPKFLSTNAGLSYDTPPTPSSTLTYWVFSWALTTVVWVTFVLFTEFGSGVDDVDDAVFVSVSGDGGFITNDSTTLPP